jgi:hypothetical protein
MRPRSMMIACTTVTAVAISTAGGLAAGEQREIVIGVLCDRTGPTQIIGVNMCPAYHDYMNLVNQRGGVEGYKIKGGRRSLHHALWHAADSSADAKVERG